MMPSSNPPHSEDYYTVSTPQQSQPLRLLREPQPLCAPVPMDLLAAREQKPRHKCPARFTSTTEALFFSIMLGAEHSWCPAPWSRQSSSPRAFLVPSAAQGAGGKSMNIPAGLDLSVTHSQPSAAPSTARAQAQLQAQAEEPFGHSSTTWE